MSFEKVNTINSGIITMPIENIDTGQIIPARFLKSINRENFGENLFRDWRYDAKNEPVKDFVLNKSDGSECILVTGKNFGCGSSREHATWAIYDYGFMAVISSSFADIFKNNALNIGLLPIEVTEKFLSKIFTNAKKNPSIKIDINLERQIVKIEDTKETETFEIPEYKKNCLLNGYDNVDYLLASKSKIEQFETKRKQIKFIEQNGQVNSCIAW